METREVGRKRTQKEEETGGGKAGAVVVAAGKVWRSQAISLDGLLDYEEGDREEGTVELSLAAEALREALASGYASALAEHLLAERCARRNAPPPTHPAPFPLSTCCSASRPLRS